MAWMENEPPAVATGNGHLLAALEILKQCKAEDFAEGIEVTFKVKTESGLGDEQNILLSLKALPGTDENQGEHNLTDLSQFV